MGRCSLRTCGFSPWPATRSRESVSAAFRIASLTWVGGRCSASGERGGGEGSAARCCSTRSRSSEPAASVAWVSGSTRRVLPVRTASTKLRACESSAGATCTRSCCERSPVSRLRAKCPDCKTFTAVALGPDYECHSCGRSFGAGLVRVPQAWGDGGEAMAEAAWLERPYPETAVVEAESLKEQSLALAADLPERPLVLGGCCCSHVGAVEGLAARQGRISVIWF